MPSRAVTYTRSASYHQHATTVTDQSEVCRRYVESHGWQLTATYSDDGTSGTSVINRPGYQRLMRDPLNGAFDVVVIEALDRLGRDLVDVATFIDQLQAVHIQLHA